MSSSWLVVLSATVAVFLVMMVGTGVRLLNWLTEEADQSLLKLITRVLFPCLIFSRISTEPAMRQPENLLLPPLIGVGTIALGLVVAGLWSRLPSGWTGLHDGRQRRTFTLCTGLFNYGFLPIPLVTLLFDKPTLGVLLVLNVGAELSIWTLGILTLAGSLERNWWKHAINGPAVAVILAVSFNLLGLDRFVPEGLMQTLQTAMEWLGQSAIPLSLILVGASIGDELRPRENGRTTADNAKVMAWSCLIRLGLLPLAFLLLAGLFGGNPALQRVLVVQAAMPSAVFSIVLARHYGGHAATALPTVLGTSLVSLVTIPLWIGAGLTWLGLLPKP